MVFRDGTKHIHFCWVPLMVNCGMEIFFAPNANIMPIDFAICMKCGLITKHKSSLNSSSSSFSCISTQNCLRFRLSSAVIVWTSCSFQGFITKRLLTTGKTVVGGIRVSILVLLMDFLGLRKSVWQSRSTFPSSVAGHPDPFALHSLA